MNTQENEMLLTAEEIAINAHFGQKDNAGASYILHVQRVANGVGEDCVARIVALLHDVIEDNEYPFQELLDNGISKEVVDAVDCLTHRQGEIYEDYIERIALNTIATRVKLSDLKDNMSVWRMQTLEPYYIQRLHKYIKSYHRLMEVYEKNLHSHKQDS